MDKKVYNKIKLQYIKEKDIMSELNVQFVIADGTFQIKMCIRDRELHMPILLCIKKL